MSLPFACSSAQPRDGIEMPNWTMPEPLQLFADWRNIAQSLGCMENPRRNLLRRTTKSLHPGTGMFGAFLQVIFVGRGVCCSILFRWAVKHKQTLDKGLSHYPGGYWRTSKALKYKYLTYCFRDNFSHVGLHSQKGQITCLHRVPFSGC